MTVADFNDYLSMFDPNPTEDELAATLLTPEKIETIDRPEFAEFMRVTLHQRIRRVRMCMGLAEIAAQDVSTQSEFDKTLEWMAHAEMAHATAFFCFWLLTRRVRNLTHDSVQVH